MDDLRVATPTSTASSSTACSSPTASPTDAPPEKLSVDDRGLPTGHLFNDLLTRVPLTVRQRHPSLTDAVLEYMVVVLAAEAVVAEAVSFDATKPGRRRLAWCTYDLSTLPSTPSPEGDSTTVAKDAATPHTESLVAALHDLRQACDAVVEEVGATCPSTPAPGGSVCGCAAAVETMAVTPLCTLGHLFMQCGEVTTGLAAFHLSAFGDLISGRMPVVYATALATYTTNLMRFLFRRHLNSLFAGPRPAARFDWGGREAPGFNPLDAGAIAHKALATLDATAGAMRLVLGCAPADAAQPMPPMTVVCVVDTLHTTTIATVEACAAYCDAHALLLSMLDSKPVSQALRAAMKHAPVLVEGYGVDDWLPLADLRAFATRLWAEAAVVLIVSGACGARVKTLTSRAPRRGAGARAPPPLPPVVAGTRKAPPSGPPTTDCPSCKLPVAWRDTTSDLHCTQCNTYYHAACCGLPPGFTALLGSFTCATCTAALLR